MRNIIKKIGIIVMSLMFAFGAYIVAGEQEVYADEENVITVEFRYTRTDGNYSDYYIKAFHPSNSMGLQGELNVSGNVGVYEYKFLKDSSIDDNVAFRVMDKKTAQADVAENIDITNINSGKIVVKINGDAKTFTAEHVTESTKGSDDSNDSNNSDNSDNSEDSSGVPIEIKEEVQDDPNADYSVKTYMVVIIDVIFFVVLGAGAYFVLSKKQNAFM